MSFIQNNILLIVGILLVLIIFEGFIIYLQNYFRKENMNSSHYVTIEKHRQVLAERDNYRTEKEKLEKMCNNLGNNENEELRQKYLQEIAILNQKIEEIKKNKNSLELKNRELTRDNAELNELLRKEQNSSSYETHRVSTNNPTISESALNEESKTDFNANSSQPLEKAPVFTGVSMDKNAVEDDSRGESSAGKTMYASFPRTAGSSIYFSDLSDNRTDDSYFELKVSNELKKATFKPIDFMKIRNYDEAMAAMRTEGAKPNVATTVLEIKPGEAHQEGKDWIINDFATIKLA